MRAIDFVVFSISLTCKYTRIDHHIFLIIDDCIKFLGRHAEQIANLVWQRTEIPNVSYRHHQFDVTRTLAANLLLCHLNTASVANDTFISDSLILATGTFIVLGRTEDAFAEQAVALRLVSTIVDGLRLGHLTIRIFQDLFR